MEYSVILDLVNTKSEANDLIKQLDGLIESLYEVKGSVESKMNKNLTQELKEALLKVCRKNKVDLNNAIAFQKFLESLKIAVQKIPLAKLSFAFEPNGDIIKKIASWIAVNLKEKVLIEIEVNPAIIGGLLIEFNGNYKDYSLRNKLSDFFKNRELLLN
ncbi:MAG: F0F1 ATP synthase subunit delta [Patescibacteria group bacterium]|jgi:F0F1-type ATP synthase delta subunit